MKSMTRRPMLARHIGLKMLLCAAASLPTIAYAQEQAGRGEPAPVTDQEQTVSDDFVPVGDIVVTGSRVVRDGFNAPAPTTVLGSAALEQRGAINISEALNDIPAFTPTTSTGTAGARPFAPGANYANLRSLGPTRTLVLVNGRRFPPSVPSFGTVGANQVDLNLIPPILLERAEVVTGGASAQYGSDAVAGVVNLILNNKFEGGKFEAEKGISQEGDNSEFRVSGMYGFHFGGGRGHIVAAGEYYQNDGVGDIYTRSWGKRDTQIVANPSPATNGLPRFIISDNVRLSTMTPGGIITAGPLRGTVFGPGGSTSQYNYGSLAGALFMIDGGIPNYGLANGVQLVPEMKRGAGFLHAEYEIVPDVTAFVEGSYGANKALSVGIQPRSTGNITIQTSNPFLPDAVRARAVGAGVTSFNMGRISDDIGQIRIHVKNENFRVATGLNGKSGDWKWDFYYQYGRNDYRQRQEGALINANFTQAVDAVRDSSGQIVCRNPANGCVPISLFGEGSPSAAAIDFVTGDAITRTLYDQHVGAANISGEPFSTWAGPVSIAAGVEYRHEKQRTTSDAISQVDGFNQQNPKPLDGAFSVREGYLETVIPLARDTSWAKNLDLNAAVRYADYSTVGGVVTWKAGVSYSVNGWLLLRGTRSRDIRAPNIFELNAAPSPTLSNINDHFTNSQVQVRQFLSGNPDLKEEVANTISAGVVLKPFRGFQMSVDYYKIDLKDAIASIQGNGTVSICAATGDPFFCGNIIRNSAGVITRINAPYVNLGTVTTEGLDVEAQYRTALGAGDISFRGVGTYTFEASSDYGTGSIDRVGEVGTNNSTVNPTPRFRGTFTTTYELGGFTGSVQLNYVAKGKYDTTYVEGVDINDNSVPAKLYTLLSLSQKVTTGNHSFRLFGTVNNLFNVKPPRVPSTTFFLPTNPAYYDTVGRNFRVGVRMSF
jgi:iron complex outermembrane receptor protein